METIRVNMTPCEDIKTIHASQNDNEAREWGFELHNNGEKIDSSSISNQLVFKAYEGGTEEILPTNGSTPTTSPFKGDIKYPQGLLSDQEFLYRESPTEEDGLAKITDIKGNTLNWNQLVQNGNFADGTNHWSGSMGTSVANNICTLTANSTSVSLNFNQTLSLKSNHKYLIKFDIMPSLNTSIMYNLYDGTDFNITKEFNATANAWYNYAEIVQPTNDIIQFYIRPNRTGTQGSTYKLKNVNILDLTQMGLDISSPSDFTSLFPLSYYSYNQGTLLSFMGNGIKTVGFNQWDEEWEMGGINDTTGEKITVNTQIRSVNYLPCFPSTAYYIKSSYSIYIYYYDSDKSFLSRANVGGYDVRNKTVTTPSNAAYMLFKVQKTAGDTTYNNDICINISSSRNGEYEPYTSSTLSLPISTYFSNGMKSAGNVFDELTETKAITRVGSVDLGSLNWELFPNYTNIFRTPLLSDMKLVANEDVAPWLCAKYEVVKGTSVVSNNKSIGMFHRSYIIVNDSSFSDATSFKNSLQGDYLVYELATPTETSFTTASLVTENAEIPLSNEDSVLIGKCTEHLSSESGFFDAKIKLADDDGECYSNKIQLHIERSPQ